MFQFFFFAILEFELRATYFLAKPLALFAVVIFYIGSHFFPQAVWTMSFLFMLLFSSWDDRCMPPNPAIVLDGDSQIEQKSSQSLPAQ
jgi:hypothetical protein